MFVVMGLIAGAVLICFAAYIFYISGQRGRGQDAADRAAAERRQQTAPHEASRAEGRGDL